MKYTPKEIDGLNGEIILSLEEFLYLYRKIFKNNDYNYLEILDKPCYLDYKIKYINNCDYSTFETDEENFTYFSLLRDTTVLTQKMIFELITYLLGNKFDTKLYHTLLSKVRKTKKFNYLEFFYYYAYDYHSTWENIFQLDEKLSYILTLKNIKNINELLEHAKSYYANLSEKKISQLSIVSNTSDYDIDNIY